MFKHLTRKFYIPTNTSSLFLSPASSNAWLFNALQAFGRGPGEASHRCQSGWRFDPRSVRTWPGIGEVEPSCSWMPARGRPLRFLLWWDLQETSQQSKNHHTISSASPSLFQSLAWDSLRSTCVDPTDYTCPKGEPKLVLPGRWGLDMGALPRATQRRERPSQTELYAKTSSSHGGFKWSWCACYGDETWDMMCTVNTFLARSQKVAGSIQKTSNLVLILRNHLLVFVIPWRNLSFWFCSKGPSFGNVCVFVSVDWRSKTHHVGSSLRTSKCTFAYCGRRNALWTSKCKFLWQVQMPWQVQHVVDLKV